MTDEDNIQRLTEYFNGTITAYVSDDYKYRNKKLDIRHPEDFVKCCVDTWNKRLEERKR